MKTYPATKRIRELWIKGKSPVEIEQILDCKINIDCYIPEMHEAIMSGDYEVEPETRSVTIRMRGDQ